MISEHTGDVSVVTGNGGVSFFLDLGARGVKLFPCGWNRRNPRFVKNSLVVEKREHVRLIGDGLQCAAAHFTAGRDQAGIGCGLIIHSLSQLLQIHQILSPCGVHTVDVLVEQVNVGSRVQRRL